ncbi:Binding-protein-dependent transport systems inner membrane component [Desulfamplus magnetovallimortis]|uniref:Binding-protein-dependent transport systems inner membrane component n=1 Tax=Desulfamplus magnetovallimortis TaxID=1246637 RepID=A0A1W1HDF2_9BACT|nr:ABC transporter permease subunit [Desulfamplus magnetovallimortis]SLM30466.1 Binding-protein-dependent transport systems inner membrane component [Desulfamplus magnetovallimortis]
MKTDPVTRKKLKRFISIKRGFFSFILLAAMIAISLFAELLINSRALLVYYNGKIYFPTYGEMIPGSQFGLGYDYETNYRELKQKIRTNAQTREKSFDRTEKRTFNFVLMPPVPFNPYENDLKENRYPPFPPSFSDRHFLGTDNVGRDILARLVYGFRTAMIFSSILLLLNYSIGITLGCAMGYFGGRFDLFFQRILEIWSNIPFLYVVIIVSSIVVPSFMILLVIMAFFGWINMTWVMRTMTYREKEREYVLAARSIGASSFRIIFRHIIPNTISVIITYAPFAISGGIVSLTSLDYLGFGLPAPTPSWGELLQQGWTNMSAWWISASVVSALVVTLMAVTFTGEGIREAFDPKMHSYYE